MRTTMPVRVGINGFGRMGRLALRAAIDNPQIKIVHINELKGGPETAAHLLEFDSVHGRWRVPITAEPDGLRVNGDHIAYTNCETPGQVPWNEAGVEIALECRASSSLRIHWSLISIAASARWWLLRQSNRVRLTS